MQPGGPVRKPYSYSVPSPRRLFKNSSTVLIEFTISLLPPPPIPFCNSWQNCQLVGWVQGRGSIVQKIAPPPPPPHHQSWRLVQPAKISQIQASMCILQGGGGVGFLAWQGLNIIHDLFLKKY
jgi:hypothetical protein